MVRGTRQADGDGIVVNVAVTYRVVHRTSYRYGAAMSDGYTVTHLLPRSTSWQLVREAAVVVTPEPDEIDERIDAFGNRVLQFGVHRPHSALVVEATSIVVVDAPPVPGDGLPWEQVVAAIGGLRGDDAESVAPFVSPTAATPALPSVAAITGPIFTPGRPVVAALRELCHRIYVDFEFDSSFSDVSTPIDTVLQARRGVCQDFAHVALACVRSLGLAGRYVSGYIETTPPPGQERLVGADASHAWCSVWVPGCGWVDLDPTNDQIAPGRHVTVGWGRDYADVAPVRGVLIGPAIAQQLDVAVDVVRVA